MKKSYNLSVLFEEEEFDAQKGYNRYGTKDAYFAVLQKFTADSETIIKKCSPNYYNTGKIDINALARYMERLQGMLADIGAVKLAWNIQSLEPLLEKKRYSEYVKKLGEILPDIERLRRRIVEAEKSEDKLLPGLKKPETNAKARPSDFKKLLMLIDNHEFDHALEIANAIRQHSYTTEIDELLEAICKALAAFNFPEAVEGMHKLIGASNNAGGPAKKSILAVDDMPDVLRTVKLMLKDKYNVFGVTSYESAIKFLRSNTADLILLDIEMPGIDGFAMLQLFRKLPDYANTPIIFLTGNVSNDHIKMAIRLGARDFIKKPVDMTVLIGKIENII